MRPFSPALAAFVLLAGAGAPASALTMSPNPLALSVLGPPVTGTLELVSQNSGVPSGGTVQYGSVAAGDLTFVFEIFVASWSGSAGDPWYAIESSGTISGAGVIPGSDADIEVAADPSPYAGVAMVFDPNAGFIPGLVPGQNYDNFFVSFSELAVGDTLDVLICGPDLVQGGFSCFSFSEASIVPEPSTALLVAFSGLAALALRRRLG